MAKIVTVDTKYIKDGKFTMNEKYRVLKNFLGNSERVQGFHQPLLKEPYLIL
jgi:hypothetical protein